MTDAPLRIWLQEPVGLEHERTWCAEPISDDDDEYHLHTREALAQSPIVQAMIAEAVERERDACAKSMDDRADYLDDAVKWGGAQKYITSIKGGAVECRNAAAAIRRRG